IAGGCNCGTTVSISEYHIICNFKKAVRMKIIVALSLHVRRANTCISHERGSAAWLHSRAGYAAAIVILSMIGAALVSHFMRHKINIKRIADRTWQTGDAFCFAAIVAYA